MNENRKPSTIWPFFTFALNNNGNNVAICKTCDYKLLCDNNLKIWVMKCIAVCTLSGSSSSWISHLIASKIRFRPDSENAIQCIPNVYASLVE